MTFDVLAQWTTQPGAGEKLNAAAKKRIASKLPQFIRDLSLASRMGR